ncbi:chorismate mutase [uncultured Dialister sp.]|jgi:monofunctional chorismate mutase|uniref:chorismate mutase n=1 Tax=uncultured Dialister sp. TaxID=278064 RepID=UPI00267521B7|nr:chorismate mutase [uncultured Dialister sp.]
MEDKELEALRNSVRSIDKELVCLFEKRLALSRSIAQRKMKAEIPVFDGKREAKNIEELSKLIEDLSVRPDFIRWYQMLMDISKKVQNRFIRGEEK